MDEETPDIMYQRLDEYEARFRKLDPLEKGVFFYAYAMGRAEAKGKLNVDFTDPNMTTFTYTPKG